MAIDIKKLNNDYTKANNALARANVLKTNINLWEADIFQHKKDFVVKQVELQQATAKNNKPEIRRLEGEIQIIRTEVQKLQGQITKAQQVIDTAQHKVDAKLAELSQDPETKKKLDSILYKKYDRKSKVEEKKKNSLVTIKEVVDNHPTIKNHLKGMENAHREINRCNRLINKLTQKSATTPLSPQEMVDLTQAGSDLALAQTKFAARQTDLVNYFAANHPDIDPNILKGLHSYGDIDRQSKGCDKTIANCTKAMSSLTVSQGLKDFTGPNPASQLPAVTTTKPSFWRHPFKWIQYQWNAAFSTPAPAPTAAPSKNEQRKSMRDELKLSKDEYNAEIVQKYLENYEKGLHDAAKQNRGNGGSSR